MNKVYDIAIIGGGASGLCAAISAARHKKSVALIEKNQRVGKKILVTGNGRCNLSNQNITNGNYNCKSEFVYDIMNCFDARDFFASLGLYCKTDSSGRIYPFSNTASSVLDALRLACTNLGVEEICNFNANDIKMSNGIFHIKCKDDCIAAKALVISTGGYQPDNSSYIIAKKLGHKLTEIHPSLCPIQCSEPILKSLKGLRVSANVTLFDGKNLVKSEYGEVQFAENALSGICIFNLSRKISNCKNPVIMLDLCPDNSENEIIKLLYDIRHLRKNSQTEDYLSGLFHKRIGQALLKDISSQKTTNDISDKEISVLCKKIKSWSFKVQKTESFKNAQVTRGGIDLSQIKPTLESKLVKNLFFCGEVLDVDGDCGGFNLNWAWASGLYAGENAAKSGEIQ